MKKILYIITKSNWGGAQKYVYDLASTIPKDSYTTVVATGGCGELTEKLAEAKIRTVSIPHLGRDVSIFDDLLVFFFLLKLFKTERPDIVHLNSSKIGGLGALAGRVYNLLNTFKKPEFFPRIKIIFTAHGWAFGEPRRSFLQRKLIKFLSWLTVILSHKTITVSNFDLKQIENTPFVKNKILTIYNGVNESEFTERVCAREKLLGEKAVQFKNTIWLGTIAELTNNKGLEYSIRAVNNIAGKSVTPQFTYIIIGEGEDEKKLSKLIKKLQLDDVVFLIGHKKDAFSLLKAFDIFLLPSLKEGLPYTLLEAGLAQIPIIASNVGGISEIIDHKKSGILTEAKKVDDIVNAINSIVYKKVQAEQFSKELFRKIRKKFSREEMLSKTKLLYK